MVFVFVNWGREEGLTVGYSWTLHVSLCRYFSFIAEQTSPALLSLSTYALNIYGVAGSNDLRENSELFSGLGLEIFGSG